MTRNPEKSTFKKPTFIRVKGRNASATTLRWFASDSAYPGDPLSLFLSLSLSLSLSVSLSLSLKRDDYGMIIDYLNEIFDFLDLF